MHDNCMTKSGAMQCVMQGDMSERARVCEGQPPFVLLNDRQNREGEGAIPRSTEAIQSSVG
jgi:hypothetical protein